MESKNNNYCIMLFIIIMSVHEHFKWITNLYIINFRYKLMIMQNPKNQINKTKKLVKN